MSHQLRSNAVIHVIRFVRRGIPPNGFGFGFRDLVANIMCTLMHPRSVESVIRLVVYNRNLSFNLLVSAVPTSSKTSLPRSISLDENNTGGDNNTSQQKLNNKA